MKLGWHPVPKKKRGLKGKWLTGNWCAAAAAAGTTPWSEVSTRARSGCRREVPAAGLGSLHGCIHVDFKFLTGTCTPHQNQSSNRPGLSLNHADQLDQRLGQVIRRPKCKESTKVRPARPVNLGSWSIWRAWLKCRLESFGLTCHWTRTSLILKFSLMNVVNWRRLIHWE